MAGLPVEDGPLRFDLGTNLVTWTATDAAGNSSACQQRVIVLDVTPPAILCPSGLSLVVPGPFPATVDYPLPVAADACDTQVAMSCVPPPGSAFALGTTTVICVAVDASGNSNQCSFPITVASAPPPGVSVCRESTPGQIRITWPQTEAEVELEGSPIINGAEAWTPVLAPRVVNSGVICVVVPATDDRHFYRLRLR